MVRQAAIARPWPALSRPVRSLAGHQDAVSVGGEMVDTRADRPGGGSTVPNTEALTVGSPKHDQLPSVSILLVVLSP